MNVTKEQLTSPLTLGLFIEFYEEKIEPRFQTLETRLNRFENETNRRFDDLYRKFEKLDTEYVAICAGLRRIEERLDRLEMKMESVEEEIRQLRVDLDLSHRRLTTLEMSFADKEALDIEVLQLKKRIHFLETRVSVLEKKTNH